MFRYLKPALASAILATGLVAAPLVFAAEPPTQPGKPEGSSTGMGNMGMGNMGMGNMNMGDMNGMSGMMDMMGQMNRMMENCNRMMESHSQPPNGQAPHPQDKQEQKG